MDSFYFDAAGDPGFQIGKIKSTNLSGGSKPFFVVCVLRIDDQEKLDEAFVTLKKSFTLKTNFEFKFHTLDVSKRIPFFREIVKQPFKGYVAVLDKMKSLQTQSLSQLSGNELTNKLVAPLIIEAISEATPPITNFHFRIDEKKHNKGVAQAMRVAISAEMRQRRLLCRSKVSPCESERYSGIQLADMVAGMVMDSFEKNDQELLKIVAQKLVVTNV